MKYEKRDAGEIWTKFKTQEEWDIHVDEFKDCIESDINERFNTCKVNVFIEDTNMVFGYHKSCMPISVDKLRNIFGDENVKFVPSEPALFPIMQYTEPENIERIADALERIASTLKKG